MSISVVVSLLALGANPPVEAVGVNIGFHCSWSGHFLFVDGMMRARPWIPFVPGSETFDSGAKVPVDDRGMPLKIPFVPAEGGPPQVVRTIFFEELEGQYPAGEYVITFKGTGLVEIEGDPGRHRLKGAGRYPIQVQPGVHGFGIVIRRSDERDPIRDLHVWLPGFEGSKKRLHPKSSDRLIGFSVLRPMQTMSVNEGEYPCETPVPAHDPRCVQSWRSRTKPNHFTQFTPRGVAMEYMIELSNQVGADFWPGIPHAVDDEWVRRAAVMIRDQLDPKLKVYVELSNEIWNSNGDYPQHEYFRAIGRRDGLAAKDMPHDDPDFGRRAYVRRAAQVFRIFYKVFGRSAKRRLVKVIPGHFGNPWHSERLLMHLADKSLNPSGIKADAVAVGAYFGGTAAYGLAGEGKEKSATVDVLLDRAEASLGQPMDTIEDDTFAGFANAHRKIAKRYGITTIAYEGGQHLVFGSGQPSPLHQVIHAANRHPRMAKLYEKMFKLWYGAGGGVFAAYAFVGNYGNYGAFGHLEHIAQPLEDAPKFQALRNQMESFGVRLAEPIVRPPVGWDWFYSPRGPFSGKWWPYSGSLN